MVSMWWDFSHRSPTLTVLSALAAPFGLVDDEQPLLHVRVDVGVTVDAVHDDGLDAGQPVEETVGDASDGGGFVTVFGAHGFDVKDEAGAVVGQPCPGVGALDAPLELGLSRPLSLLMVAASEPAGMSGVPASGHNLVLVSHRRSVMTSPVSLLTCSECRGVLRG